MSMRITWGKVHPDTGDKYEQTHRATVVAKGKNVKGLRGRWLVQDAQDKDAGGAVSLWDSLAGMQTYEHSALYQQEIVPSLQPFFVGEYKTHRCEVKYVQDEDAE